MNKVLLDTNVLVYSIDEESRYFGKAQAVLLNTSIEKYTTSKNLSEFLTVITRFPEKSLSIEDALLVINDFQSLTTILYPTDQSFSIFLNLMRKYKPHGLQIHDIEIISIGLANQIRHIATLNIKDFIVVEEIDIFSA